ncbi:MAG: LptA/OstA family protein, partial [Pseudomonadota bacterium]
MPGLPWFVFCLVAWVALSAGQPATAQPESAAPIDADEARPVLIEADSLNYDDALDIVIAAGSVEIIDGDSLLRADRVVYNRRSGVAAASGNVVVVDEDGNVLFAEYAELEEGLAQGFIEQANIL